MRQEGSNYVSTGRISREPWGSDSFGSLCPSMGSLLAGTIQELNSSNKAAAAEKFKSSLPGSRRRTACET